MNNIKLFLKQVGKERLYWISPCSE